MRWMAPEQVDAKEVGPAADQYALGLIAYALLAGTLPWPEQANDQMVLLAKGTGRLKPLHEQSSVATHVSETVAKALSVDTRQRFESCAAFVEALDTFSSPEAYCEFILEELRKAEGEWGLYTDQRDEEGELIPVLDTVNGISNASELFTAALALGNSQVYLPGSKDITALPDLGFLASLTNLNEVDLTGRQALTDITPLIELKNLTRLNLSGCHALTDITALKGLNNLTDLNLRGCVALTDINGLQGLNNLTELWLSNCKALTDITALKGLNNLTGLNLSECEALKDITPLQGLKNLTSLNLGSCKALKDITALKGLNNLTDLNLSD